jgi:hypothetical protein
MFTVQILVWVIFLFVYLLKSFLKFQSALTVSVVFDTGGDKDKLIPLGYQTMGTNPSDTNGRLTQRRKEGIHMPATKKRMALALFATSPLIKPAIF